MLGDTFVLPQAGGDITLKKIREEGYSSEYMFRDSTSRYVVKIRHTKVKATTSTPEKDRHNLEVVQTIFAAGAVAEYERKFYFVHENLPADTSVALANAAAAKAVASSNALLVALLNWES
jgi:uncharacterized membrane-anchored protein